MKSFALSVTCEDIEGNLYQVPIEDLTFRPTVYGIIIKDNKILLSKQWDGYDFPGGGIELGETLEEALVREVKEETGLDVKVGNIVHCQTNFFKLPFRDTFVHSIHHLYNANVIAGEISTDFLDDYEKKYAEQAEWVELRKLNEIKMLNPFTIDTVLKRYL